MLVLNLFDAHSQSSIFLSSIYTDKENNPEFEKKSYPTQPTPTLEKRIGLWKKKLWWQFFFNKIIEKK